MLLLACASAVNAQANRKDSGGQSARPDFSGTWRLDKSRSGNGTTKFDFDELTITVVHRDPELRITKRKVVGGNVTTEEFVHHTDGRGDKALTSTPGQNLQTKAMWKKDRLHFVHTESERVGGRFIYFDVTDWWELSKDGREIRQTTRVEPSRTQTAPGVFIPSGDFKRVYVRVP